MCKRPLSALVLLASVLSAAPALAQDVHIYDGITVEEFVAFAEGEGWDVRIESAQTGAVSVRFDDAFVYILMRDCDAERRCRSGVIQEMTYHFVEPTQNFWHWNLGNHGATGFGPSYVTLQRHLHFAGVTDQYLREVIGEVWPAASGAFWTEVEEMEAANRSESE